MYMHIYPFMYAYVKSSYFAYVKIHQFLFNFIDFGFNACVLQFWAGVIGRIERNFLSSPIRKAHSFNYPCSIIDYIVCVSGIPPPL
jgi:hypothetical protein